MITPLFFFMPQKENTTLKQYQKINNRICILRSYGGLGDIIAMRMIFEDLKTQFPEFHITWAVPHCYFPVAKNHPFIDDVVCSHTYAKSEYLQIFNLSTVCTRHEWKYKKYNQKNRADIWANHFGLNLNNHNIFMPSFKTKHPNIVAKLKALGWDGNKKIVLFAPISAIPVKNLTVEQVAGIKDFTDEHFLVILHTHPALDFLHLKIPTLCNLDLDEAMAAVELCDYCIATDTGILHAAAGYKKPSLGIFSFVDGYVYCKYYPTVQVVQKHYKDEPSWCGPCHDFPNCPKNPASQVKPCITELDINTLKSSWFKLLNNG